MTDPPIIGDVALARRAPLPRPARRHQPGRLPGDRGRARPAREPGRRRAAAARSSRLPAPRRPRRRDRRDDARRLEAKGARAGADRVIPNWVDTAALDAAAARQRLGARARARRPVRRHALGQRRPRAEPRRAGPRGDVPARPRRPARRDRRRRARATPSSCGSPSGSRPTRCASCRTSRATCCRSRSRPRTSTSSGSRAGLSGYVVPSRLYGVLAVGRPRDRGRGRRERDGAARRARSAAASSSRRAGPSCSRAAIRERTTGEPTSRRWAARPRVRRARGGPRRRGRPVPRAPARARRR